MDALLLEDNVAENNVAVRTFAHCDRHGLNNGRPSRRQAEEAVRTLIRWAGDDPSREGLLDTPRRVARAYEEWFAGYAERPAQLLERCFQEIAGYDEMVLLRDIRFESHCEHHIAPIIGSDRLRFMASGRLGRSSRLPRSSFWITSTSAASGTT